jgi:hypothetical protein
MSPSNGAKATLAHFVGTAISPKLLPCVGVREAAGCRRIEQNETCHHCHSVAYYARPADSSMGRNGLAGSQFRQHSFAGRCQQ